MKSVSEFHREGLDHALRQALGTSQPALRRQALTQAATHLIHPRLVLESPLLTEDHPWYREALIVSDAFEAVTNGMEEPGVLSALDELVPDSPFVPWRHLILALHFFYEHLDEAVVAHLSAIPDHSPVSGLAQAVRALVHPALPRLGSKLLEAVAEPDAKAVSAVQDVSEGLETEDEALFWSGLTDWLEAVVPHDDDRAKSAVLWAWNQLEWRPFDEAVLLDLTASLWGRTESYRLAALGSLPWDAEGAALLWLRFLLADLREGADRSRVEEAWGWLPRFHAAAEAEGTLGTPWEDTWHSLLRVWNLEVELRQWTNLRWNFSEEPAPAHPAPAPDGQLDLFA